MTGLRDYQLKAVDDLRRSFASGHRAPILVIPCGGGKTVVARAIIEGAVAKGSRVLFLAPRRELVYQCSEKLQRAGVPHAILMAGEPMSRLSRVQVACVPTLHARGIRNSRIPMPEASVVILDECQFAGNETTSSILSAYPNAIKIGLSATPARKSGKSLGDIFDDMVFGPSVQELTDLGFLVPVRYFVPSKPDLKGVKIQAGDYNEKQLGERMDSPTLIGDVLTNWLRVARDRKTVIFTVNVAHSLHIEQAFREAGISVAHLDADTPLEERRAVQAKLHAGEVQVLTNCDLFSYGWDEPSISCCVLARPTKSLVRYLQTAGRILRPYEGKTDAIILDHGDCVREHGLVSDFHEWSLDSKTTVKERDAKREKKQPKDIVCEECAYVFRSSNVCPGCGWVMPTHKAEALQTIDDDLAELKGAARLNRQWTPEQKERFLGELKTYANRHGYSEGWCSHKYRAKFGVWPNAYRFAEPAEPQPETLAWLKSQAIRFAKSKQRMAA